MKGAVAANNLHFVNTLLFYNILLLICIRGLFNLLFLQKLVCYLFLVINFFLMNDENITYF